MVSWNCKFNLKVFPSYYYFLFYQHWQLLLKWTDSLIYNSKTTWQRCFLWGPTQDLLLLCRFVKKHGHHVTLKILIGRFSRNFFSRTAEGIELKSGIYVPMNVFNMCCVTVCAIWKFKMATSGGQSLHWNPMGNNIFIFFLRTAKQNLTKLGRDVSCEVLKSCPGLY